MTLLVIYIFLKNLKIIISDKRKVILYQIYSYDKEYNIILIQNI